MSGGVLVELLLVHAEGLKHSRLLGSLSQYVIIECGSQTANSKLTRDENGKAWWNEKFFFKLSASDSKKLKRIKLKIMEKEKKFSDEDLFIGEATIHITEEILRVAKGRGSLELKPAPYNIVLEDQTFKGEIKVGLKFIDSFMHVSISKSNRILLYFISVVGWILRSTVKISDDIIFKMHITVCFIYFIFFSDTRCCAIEQTEKEGTTSDNRRGCSSPEKKPQTSLYEVFFSFFSFFLQSLESKKAK
ncbi:Elicitor-responsive protein 1 [Apostasia shenzhenica]|uniref:Elicitor-responsive protein 1 n=1 Tax=Apostasia shenzhenica TaxID=1088818 RepID=A0A2I0AHI8_9ASPA|nr:Elicitor-responsive protein 1 [Apostasia shenzhenica]